MDSIFTPVRNEFASRQYHEQIVNALEQMERGERLYIVISEPSGMDTEGEGLDILALGSGEFSVFYYSHSQDSEPNIVDTEGFLKLYAQVMYGIEAADDAAATTDFVDF